MTGKAATGTAQIRPPEQDYAPAVSSHEDPLSVVDGFSGADGDVERELAVGGCHARVRQEAVR